MTNQDLNILGSKMKEKEIEFADLMAKFPKGTRMSPNDKQYAESLSNDIKFLSEQYDRTEKTVSENRAKGTLSQKTEDIFGKDRISRPQFFNSDYEGKKMAFYTGHLYASQMPHLTETARRDHAEKASEYFGISVEELKNRALSESVGGNGGFLVPTILEDMFISNRLEYSVIEKKAQVVPVSTDRIMWPRRQSGVTVYNMSENQNINFVQPVLNNVEVNVQTLGAIIQVSNQLMSDSILTLGDFLSKELLYATGYAIDKSAIYGQGDSANFGIQGLSAGFANNTTAMVSASAGSSASWNNITMRDIGNLIAAYPSTETNETPEFYCSQGFYGQVLLGLSINTLGNTMQDYQVGIKPTTGGLQRTFLGYNLNIVNVMPGTCNSIANQQVLYFGNLDRVALFADRSGSVIDISNVAGSSFLQNASLVRLVRRFGLTIHDLTILQGDNATLNAGPFVCLATA